MKSKKGLTLVELVIVLAIIAILGAMMIPYFVSMTGKARLRSDIHSARIIQNAIELYNTEQARLLTGADLDGMIKELNDKGYLKSSEAIIQTEGAKWELDAVRGVVVNISGSSEDITGKAFNQLSEQEKLFVVGGKV